MASNIWWRYNTVNPKTHATTSKSFFKNQDSAPFSSNQFTVIMESDGVWKCMLLRKVAVLKNASGRTQIPPCGRYILFVIAIVPFLLWAIGCFRVCHYSTHSHSAECKSVCVGSTQRTFTLCCLDSPYLLGAGSAQWSQAHTTMLIRMSLSWVGTLIHLSQIANS